MKKKKEIFGLEYSAACELVNELEKRLPESSREYFRIHVVRYIKTLMALPHAAGRSARGIEIGSYGMFATWLLDHFGYNQVDTTVYDENNRRKILTQKFEIDEQERDFVSYNIDLQKEYFPIDGDKYDFTMCAEVIEHMTVDPMFLLGEINRILKPGGVLFLSTPNVASAESLHRILNGGMATGYYYFRRNGSSDRHNIEYTPNLLQGAVEAAGFKVTSLRTEYCWFQERPEIDELLANNGYPTDMRGDNIFLICKKVSPVVDWTPSTLYD